MSNEQIGNRHRNLLVIINHYFAKVLLYCIRGYQFFISPILPAHCRYYPTCSSYGLEAIRLHGGFYGGLLIIKRISRCHPWGGSGIDFVPLPLYRYCYSYIMVLPVGWCVFRA